MKKILRITAGTLMVIAAIALGLFAWMTASPNAQARAGIIAFSIMLFVTGLATIFRPSVLEDLLLIWPFSIW